MRNQRLILAWILCAALGWLAPVALAQTQSVVTITNPVLPLLGGPDVDGRLVPTSQTFQEGGMHVESFWIKNNGTTFVPSHFHLHINNQYETTHGFATVPGLGPTDKLGFYIEREDGGLFDLNSLDYRLKQQTLATDMLIGPDLDPSLPVGPQLTHFPVVKLPTFQTLTTPGFTGVSHLWLVWELGESVELNQAETDNLVFTFPAGSCDPSVVPGVLYEHEGLADPATEGWTREGTATGVTEGPVAADLGNDAWSIDDDGSGAGSTLLYRRNLTPDEMCWARTSGFSLRSLLRVVDVPDTADASVALSFFDSQRLFELRLGMDAAGHPIASISGQSVTLSSLDSGYHDYELVYDPPTRTVDLRVDGNEVLSNRPGLGLPVAAPRIAFGSNDVAGVGHGHYSQVEFELPQDCANRFDDDGDGLVDYPADPGCSGPDDATEATACNDGVDSDGDTLVDFPADPGCADANDDSEQSVSLVCDDGADNDADTFIDFPADAGCASSSDPSETAACGDGLDDDGDGLVDFPADPGCASADDDSEKAAELVCDDGADNDGDTLTDFPADAGCASPSDASETSACDNGADDDGDGQTDFPADAGCDSANDDSEASPALVCDDGADNDGDTLVDYPADPGCASSADLTETSACDDGLDDDGDGFVDFPADPGCASANDDSEQAAELVCDDGADNDADTFVDFPLDPGCADPSDASETSVCDDGADNDGDTLADFPADPGCADANDDSEQAVALVCDDGADNDGDTFVDFPADAGCSSGSDATETSACDNGVDDDGDGQTDFGNDGGCDSANDDSEKSPALICDDGIDNEGDGFADFPTDPGCATPADATETSACDNGLDDDGDGFVDSPADPGCANAADDSEQAAELVCDDGIDNDADGFIDFPADVICTSPAGGTETSACNDGIDNDGDGAADFPGDQGCVSGDDDSEKELGRICDDGVDQDGDGAIDFPADIGCRDRDWTFENPKCQDGVDNEPDGGFDFDGGASLNGGVPLGPVDAGCESKPFKNSESVSSNCGFGAELAFVMPLLAFWMRRQRA